MKPSRPHAPRLGDGSLLAHFAFLVSRQLVLSRQQTDIGTNVGFDGRLSEEEREAESALDVNLRVEDACSVLRRVRGSQNVQHRASQSRSLR